MLTTPPEPKVIFKKCLSFILWNTEWPTNAFLSVKSNTLAIAAQEVNFDNYIYKL